MSAAWEIASWIVQFPQLRVTKTRIPPTMQLVDAVMAAAAFAGLLGRFEDFRRESEGRLSSFMHI